MPVSRIYYYTITQNGKDFCYVSFCYGRKKAAAEAGLPVECVRFGVLSGLPLWGGK